MKEIDESPLLTSDEEHQLGKLVVEENDPQARERLVRSNLRLVVNIAKKFCGRGIGLADLIEEGNLGLIKAIDYFDPERGTRFSTYAAWWIKQSIKRALLTNVQPVHVPTYMVSLMNQWRRTAAELEAKLGRPPEIQEMADVMQLPLRKSKIIHGVVKIISSVKDATFAGNSDDDQTDEITLPDNNADRPEDGLVADEERAKVLKLLDELDPREARVLKLHYGLEKNKPMALKEIGQELGLTRERIRQIQRAALAKLYEHMNEE